MSVRRSRIQVKPNLGVRGAKPGERASSRPGDEPAPTTKPPDVKPTSPVKGQVKPTSPVKIQRITTTALKPDDNPVSPVRAKPKSTPPSPVKPQNKSPQTRIQNEVSKEIEQVVSPKTRLRSSLEKTAEAENSTGELTVTMVTPEANLAQQNPIASVMKESGDESIRVDSTHVASLATSDQSKAQILSLEILEPAKVVGGKASDATGKSDREDAGTVDANSLSQPDSSGDASSSTKAQTTERAQIEKTDKAKPKPRGRYGNRAKPNLSEAGRPRARQTAQKTEAAVEVKKSAEQAAEMKSQPDRDGTVHSRDASQVSESCHIVPGVEKESEQVEALEAVDVAVEEVVTGGDNSALPEGVVETGSKENEHDDEVFIPPAVTGGPAEMSHPTVAVSEKVSIAENEAKGQKPAGNKTEGPKVRRKPIKVQAAVDQPPDKFKMKMKDLIYWNPTSNPMKISDKMKKSSEAESAGLDKQETTIEEVVPASVDNEEEESLPVPQVKIGPDGAIILNEESLVINNRPSESELMSDINTVDETDALITYASFRQRRLGKNWTEKETERFFWALSVVGTDFSLMSNLFKRRNRHDLKKKFKREEKHNRSLVDKALLERREFDMAAFENVTDEDEEEVKPKRKPRAPKVKKEKSTRGRGRGRGTAANNQAEPLPDDYDNDGEGREKTNKTRKQKQYRKPAKRRKRSGYYDDASEESSEEELEISSNAALCDDGLVENDVDTPQTTEQPEEVDAVEEDDGHMTLARKDRAQSSDEDESRVLESMCQKTRSGRQPKRTNFFNVDEPEKKRAKKISTVKNPDAGKNIVYCSPPVNPTPVREYTGNQSREIQTVQNIPNVGGGQLVLVTQKGENSQGQGTMIHVYMLSPTSNRTPDWPRSGQSPRAGANRQVYSVSPRASAGQSPSHSAITISVPSPQASVMSPSGVHSSVMSPHGVQSPQASVMSPSGVHSSVMSPPGVQGSVTSPGVHNSVMSPLGVHGSVLSPGVHTSIMSPPGVHGSGTSPGVHSSVRSPLGVHGSVLSPPGVHSATSTTSPQCLIGASPLRTNTDIVNIDLRTGNISRPVVTNPTNINTISPHGEVHVGGITCVDIPIPTPVSPRCEVGVVYHPDNPIPSVILSTGEGAGQIEDVDIATSIAEATPEFTTVTIEGPVSEVTTSNDVLMEIEASSDDIPSILCLDPISEETVMTTETITTLEQAIMEAIS